MGEHHEHERAVAWLRLLRLPNFVTVPGDPLAGFALASGFAAGTAAWPVAAAVAASLCIYAAGMQRDSRALTTPKATGQPLDLGTIVLKARQEEVGVSLSMPSVTTTSNDK